MNRRTMKFVALTLSGGLLFQLASCVPLLAELVIGNVGQLLITQLLSSALGGGTTP